MADVSDWYVRFADPIWVRPRRHLDHFNRNASWFNGTGQRATGWLRNLSEPVRSRVPLPRGAIPYLFSNIAYVSYRFALVEAGDTGTLNFTSYPAKNLAQVTITDVKVYETQVTINNIVYHREYS